MAGRIPGGIMEVLLRATARKAEPAEPGPEPRPECLAGDFAKVLESAAEDTPRRSPIEAASDGDAVPVPPLSIQPQVPPTSRSHPQGASIGRASIEKGSASVPLESPPAENGPLPAVKPIRQAALTEATGTVTPEPPSQVRGPRIDLPVFLQVLPKADRSVALAASREPAMAAALRGLPRIPDLPAMAAWGRANSLSPPSSSLAQPSQIGRDGPVQAAAVQVVAPVQAAAVQVVAPVQVGPAQVAQAMLPQLKLPQFLSRPMTLPPAADAVLKAPGAVTGASLVDPSMPAAALLYTPPGNASFRPMTDAPVFAGTLSAPLGTDPWQQDLSAQLALMAGQGEEAYAVMKLSPAELGDLEIRLTVRDGEASVEFAAAAPEARAALELAQPRLQEMFAAQGLSLSQTHIFNMLEGHPDMDSWRRPVVKSDVATPVDGDEDGEPVPRRVTLGIVDTYA
jgi:flagellar hook-length control protein FliK